jgi:UDP:flavonoid glycosyltransferase YjiC (YdhE family)
MGSSGRADLVPTVLEGLAKLDVDVALSMAGRPIPAILPTNVVAAPYLPGDLAARKAAVVVSNGGSSTGYQALAEGTPVVGIPYNLDQYLATTAIRNAGAGELLRSGTVTPTGLAESVTRVLREGAFRRAAGKVAEEMRSMRAAERFRSVVDALAGRRHGASIAAPEGGPRTVSSA